MVQDQNEFKILEPHKSLIFDDKVSLEVLSKFGTNFSHLAWRKVKEMKPSSILC